MSATKRHFLLAISACLLWISTAPVSAGDRDRGRTQTPAVKGRVFADSAPLEAAKVYAYEVASYAMRRVLSDDDGHFSFRSLPAGMYQIVAFKDGFAPAVELLLRRSSDENQFLKIQLKEESQDMRQAEDYWSVRSRIPVDVLRDIHSPLGAFDSPFESRTQLANGERFAGQMYAQGGTQSLGDQGGEVQHTTAELALRGALGKVEVGVTGSIQQLSQTGESTLPDGEATSLRVEVEPTENSSLSLSTASAEATGLDGDRTMPVGMQSYQLSWAGKTGSKGESGFTAHYMDETNLYQMGWLNPADVPDASSALDLEGFYKTVLGAQTTLETGIAYRQRMGGVPGGPEDGENEALDVYGIAGSQVQPRIFVEYGLYSSVRDGSLSLMPHGGMVVSLGGDWRAKTAISQRIENSESPEDLRYRGFNAAFYDEQDACKRSGDACYELKFAHGEEGEHNSISLGAIHREFAETLRLYFSPDFFDRLESVFVVDGDRVPEVQFSMVRRIAPRVLARLESNFASGGGGIFYATDDFTYENKVRYLVTSIDTRFQSTATGVFVAFHHLEQALNPLQEGAKAPEMEMQRLQLMLTQDLSALADMAADFAVRFNVELSRGANPYTLRHDDDELHKKLTGGISVSF